MATNRSQKEVAEAKAQSLLGKGLGDQRARVQYDKLLAKVESLDRQLGFVYLSRHLKTTFA